MQSIKDRVAIIGMGCTRFGERWDTGPNDLIIEAADEALKDAGVECKDIQAAWVGTWTSGDGGVTLGEALKLQYIPITRVENFCVTGTDALRNASYAVAAGIYDLVLVLGFEKLKDTGWSMEGNGLMPRGTWREVNGTGPGFFALLATGYFAKYGLSPEQGKRMISMIPVNSHHNGFLNPKAHLRVEVTLEQVINSPLIAWPLGLFDCCGVTDGAAAAIITSVDKAKDFRQDPVYIKSMQLCAGHNGGSLRSDYEFDHVEETRQAGLRAYQEAGITNAREQISIAEVHDCFSITEAVIMEDLQFSPRGRVKEDLESGFFTLTGGLPVQTDGGLKSFGHPIGASGLRMTYEVYKQLQGKAGPRQVINPVLGLAHSLGGRPWNPVVSVSIFGR